MPTSWSDTSSTVPRIAITLGAIALVSQLFGCLAAETRQSMERTYRAATERISARPEEPAVEPDLDLAAPLERDAVIALAVARSPSLAAMAHRVRALIHAAEADGSLPSAELGVQAWNLPLTRPYAVGEADMYMVELQQRFPAAGSRSARARATLEDAQALLAEVASEERLTARRAADAFAEYVQGTDERLIQTRQLALLEQMGRAVAARYSSGGAGLADVARIELETSKTQRAIARTEGDIARARFGLNALLRRPSSEPLGPPREVPTETVHLSIGELLARAATSRGSALAAEARVRAASARREAADAEARIPEFMVGLGYWQAPQARPGVGASVSMSLPWFWGPQRNRAAQAHEEEAAELSTRDAVAIDTQTEVTEAQARLASIESQLVVVNDQAIPAARHAIDALAATYATGISSLLEWIDAARSVLDLHMEEVALIAELAHAIAELEQAVGEPLPRVELDVEPSR